MRDRNGIKLFEESSGRMVLRVKGNQGNFVKLTFTQKQKYENKGEGIRIDKWITNNIDQYALCLDLDKYVFLITILIFTITK